MTKDTNTICKMCPRCKTSKSVSDFSLKKRGGLHSYCRSCASNRTRIYYRINREKELGRVSKYYSVNRELKRKNYQEWSWKLKLITLEKYGGECACCGENEPKFLAIDHMENNGNQHRKEIGNIKIYSWLKKNNYPSNFQILCHNCNMAKAFWKTCPHKEVNVGGKTYKATITG